MAYTTGTAITFKANFRNTAGTLANPTEVYLRITRPVVDEDGVTTYETDTYRYGAAEITRSATGKYEKAITPADDEYGEWIREWEGTGTVAIVKGGPIQVDKRLVEVED